MMSHYVITRKDGTIAFSGKATSKEKLLRSAIQEHRANKSKLKGNVPSDAFHNLNLDGFEFHALDANGIDFTGSTMRKFVSKSMSVNGCYLNNVDMTDARIVMFGDNARFSGAEMTRCDISGSELNKANFSFAKAEEMKAIKCVFSKSVFDYSTILRSDISLSKFESPSFYETTVIGSDFSGTYFTLDRGGIQNIGMLPRISDPTKGSVFKGCTYGDTSGKIDKEFKNIIGDRKVSRVADYAMTAAAAIMTGIAIENGMKYLEPYLEGTHNMTIWGIALLAGTAFLRELISDRVKEGTRDALTKVWSSCRNMTARMVKAGTNITDVICAIGPKKGMRPLKIAIQSQMSSGDKSGMTGLILDIVKDVSTGQSMQIITCDRKNMARAMEALTRFYHGKHSRKGDISILMCDGGHNHSDEMPCSLYLGKNGDMTASWFSTNAEGHLECQAFIRYGETGKILESSGYNGKVLTQKEIELMEASDPKLLIKSFVKHLAQEAPMKERGVMFDLQTSYIDVSHNGDFSIRSAKNNRIDNKYSAALYSATRPSAMMFAKDGRFLPHNEGWDMVKNRIRPPEIVVSDSSQLDTLIEAPREYGDKPRKLVKLHDARSNPVDLEEATTSIVAPEALETPEVEEETPKPTSSPSPSMF